MRKYIIGLFALFLACGTIMQSVQKEYSDFSLSPQFDRSKRYRLAVLPVNSHGIEISTSELNALSDFISLEMLKTGHFLLIERKEIDALLKEQEFGASGIVDVSTAAQIGKVLGADVVMLTQISELKRDEFFEEVGAYDAKVFVRIIDVSTAEILFYGKGRGESLEGKVDAIEMAICRATRALQGGMK